jgi:hypothetical protein
MQAAGQVRLRTMTREPLSILGGRGGAVSPINGDSHCSAEEPTCSARDRYQKRSDHPLPATIGHSSTVQ